MEETTEVLYYEAMGNRAFRYLPHTADAKFQAFGKSLEEAFSNSGKALTGIIADVKKIKTVKAIKKVLHSDTVEHLLVDFLTELLFELETKGFLLNDTEDLKIEKRGKEYSLEGKLLGDDVKHYKTHGHVKAITYHELKIEKKNLNYMIQVVVDI